MIDARRHNTGAHARLRERPENDALAIDLDAVQGVVGGHNSCMGGSESEADYARTREDQLRLPVLPHPPDPFAPALRRSDVEAALRIKGHALRASKPAVEHLHF